MSRIAKWDGETWAPLRLGVNGRVRALQVFDDGAGPALYVAGDFTMAGGAPANRIAKWDGLNWAPLGNGLTGFGALPGGHCMAVHDDGTGEALYVGGNFNGAGEVLTSGIAKWNGSNWAPVRHGLNGTIRALAVFDDGSGPALFVGGTFTQAGKGPAARIAKWDGSEFIPLGAGLNNEVMALLPFDDGSGPALFVGGQFSTAGGNPANRIARWDGSNWAPLGSGMNATVNALTAFDDGSGPQLVAGGGFTTAGSSSMPRIAKWNGTSWSPLGSGMGGMIATYDSGVHAFADREEGGLPVLYVGGDFALAVDSGDSYLARWVGSPAAPASWTDLGFSLPGISGAPQLSATGVLSTGLPNQLDLSDARASAPSALIVGNSPMHAPFKGGVLVPEPLIVVNLVTGLDGTLSLPFVAPALPAGISLYFQTWIQDAAALQGFAASNALQGVSS